MRRAVLIGCSAVVALVAAAARLPAEAAAPYSLLGQSAPDFALRQVAGPNVRLSEHRGDVVVVTFWGSRCGPCSPQLAALERSRRTFATAGLRIFGVNVDDDQARARQYAGAQSVGYPLLLDPGKTVSRLYRVDNLPMTILIDRGGAVRHVHRDYDGNAEALYLQQLRALLNE